MRGLSCIKTVAYFSLIFVILNIIFSYDKGINNSGLIFIWVIVVNYGVAYISNKYYKYGICILMFSIPLLFNKGIDDILFSGLIMVFSVFYCYKEIENNNYGEFVDSFKKGVLIIILASLMAIFSLKFNSIGTVVAPYLIIYFISSIAALRTLRLREYTSDNKLLHKLNIRYSMMIIIMSFILSIKVVRELFIYTFKGILEVISFVAELLLTLVGYVLRPIFQYIFDCIKYLMSHGKGKTAQVKTGGTIFGANKHKGDYALDVFTNSLYFKIIIGVILGCIICYVIFSIFTKASRSQGGLEFYEEEKEFITENKENRHSLIKALTNLIRPKDNYEYIRFFYTKYLKLATKQNIEITITDTSQDVLIKTKDVFNLESTNIIRDIYIKIRYGREIVEDKTRQNFSESYKKLKPKK